MTLFTNSNNMKLELIEEKAIAPKGVFLILGGSGKIDKDGNHRLFKMNIYSDISRLLNNLKYTTFRYSKRGTGKSEGKHNYTGLQDLLSDIHDVVTHIIEKYPELPIYLIGHSEGAMLATLYSSNHQVDGMILISGAGIGLKDAMQIQNTYLAQEVQSLKGFKGRLLRLLVNEQKMIKQQNKIFVRVSETNKDVIRVQLVPIAAKWMREHFEFESCDYTEILKNTLTPTLVLQGNKDAHTNLDFVKNISNLENPVIYTAVLSNVDHILREYSGDISILNIKKQYKKEVKESISDSVRLAIESWVTNL